MNFRFICWYASLLIFLSNSVYASGGYDNGSSIDKGNIGIDLTWNPFNHWEKGQSYAGISYGITNKLNLHGYYSIPAKGKDNYYIGIFYQFIKYKYLDLATAIGIRNYNPKFEKHLFGPQLLYSIHPLNKISIGGSIVAIRNIKNNYKLIGTTIDIGLILPILKNNKINKGIYSIDFTIGAFKPILWKPDKGLWHPTYSFDFKINV